MAFPQILDGNQILYGKSPQIQIVSLFHATFLPFLESLNHSADFVKNAVFFSKNLLTETGKADTIKEVYD